MYRPGKNLCENLPEKLRTNLFRSRTLARTFSSMRKALDHDPRRITRFRVAAGLTKAALARAIGCSRSLITEYESGMRNANNARLQAIAKVLDCDVDELRAKRLRADGARPPAIAPAARALLEVRSSQRSDGPQDVPELRRAPVADRTA